MASFAAIVFALQPRPYYQDASMFVQLGRGLLTGRAPYSGLFDHKPFGICLVGALAWLLDPGDTTVSMQALSVVAISIAATACGWVVSTVFSRFWPGVATALCVAAGLSLPVLSSGGGTSELFSEAGLAVCAACVVGMIGLRRGYRWPAVAGGAFAWAFGCSLLAVAAVPALLVLWLTIPIDGEPYNITRLTWRIWVRRRLLDRRLAAAAGAGLLVTLAIWSPVVITGSVSAALDALIRYNSLYQAYSTFDLYGWIKGIKTIAPLWVPTLAVCLIPTARRRLLGLGLLADSNLFRAAAVWFVVALALQLFGRRFFDHYLLVLVPSLGLLFGCAVAGLRLERVRVNERFVGWALCIVVASGLVWRSTLPNDIPSTADNAQLAAYMHANSAATDTVLVWGYDPDLYLESDREPTGRYISMLPFLVPGYQQETVTTTLQQWQTHPPLLVVTGFPGSQSGLWTLDDSVTSLAPLESFVRSHYEKIASLHGGEVWKYRG
jgi:hypothetical protein